MAGRVRGGQHVTHGRMRRRRDRRERAAGYAVPRRWRQREISEGLRPSRLKIYIRDYVEVLVDED